MAKKIKDKERDKIDFGKSRIAPLFNSIFFPTLLSMVFASFFTIADGIFVGQGVGSNALAAINIVSPLFLITTGIALMFGVGVSVVASIHLSQNNSKAANINITQAFHVATLLMVFIAITVYFFRIPFFKAFGKQRCTIAIMPGLSSHHSSRLHLHHHPDDWHLRHPTGRISQICCFVGDISRSAEHLPGLAVCLSDADGYCG